MCSSDLVLGKGGISKLVEKEYLFDHLKRAYRQPLESRSPGRFAYSTFADKSRQKESWIICTA